MQKGIDQGEQRTLKHHITQIFCLFLMTHMKSYLETHCVKSKCYYMKLCLNKNTAPEFLGKLAPYSHTLTPALSDLLIHPNLG